MKHELHPLCTLFPRIDGAEFSALVADIKANGLRESIVLHEGMVLDGGNRYRACNDAGIEPRFVEFDGPDIVAFVLSANLHRRHLSAGQHAAIVASVTNWAAANKHGGDRRSDQAAILPLETIADRAAASGASARTQRMADAVAKADPDLAKAVGQGTTTLPKAVEQITGKRPGAKLKQPAAPARAAPRPAEPEPEYHGPSAEEIAEAEASARDDAERVRLILDSDDVVMALTEKCAQQAAHIRILESRIAGLTNANAEHIRTIKRLRREAERAAA